MDEYLFLTAAKLKADRLRLERAERRPSRRPTTEPRRDVRPKPAPHDHPILSLVNWR